MTTCNPNTRNGTMRQQRGFTLIELMIVVVILGIITTIAVTAFSGATQDSERSRIIAELNSLNDAMARYYQGNYAYTGATVATLRGTSIQASKAYTVTVSIPTAQTYFLIATPVATGTMKGTGVYSVNQTGQRCHFSSDTANPATDGCPHVW